MAGPYYVRSTDGSDASDGLTWANAKATLAGALAVAAAGERIWVSQAHAETQASAMTLTSPGTAAAPVEILCGNDAAEPPTALATTATVTTTGAFGITFGAGVAYVYGVTFSSGSGVVNASLTIATASSAWSFDTCTLSVVCTGSSSLLILGASGTALTIALKNVTLSLGAAGQTIRARTNLVWDGGSLAGTAPTALLSLLTASLIRIRGVDLSLVTGALVNVANGPQIVKFEQCKLAAGVALTTGTNPGQWGVVVELDNCDSADTQYRMQRHQYEGNVYSETTVVRTGGASDGTTPLAHKMVSSANAKFTFPLYGPEMIRRFPGTAAEIAAWTPGASKTATVEFIHDSVTNLQDDEIWLEVEYLGTSGFPLSLFVTDRMTDILATPADQTDSSATWTTTGLTNPNTQKLVVTFTPQEVGIIRARVAVGKASQTVYIDPLITVA